ncbi:von Willebrand factor type A domain protein [Polystyrenella longa]|uniref:von Willebrand factor type A domain protein n=1 Tax=Polystyrenella longa TaxID=2528007 RepID=A0A518CHT0_9PLAN|nr:VWA domain-containing protein [Polystyrenella longa]QDU78790.1 von Willebrand factor type A domain protein [Polystyrenella longa]
MDKVTAIFKSLFPPAKEKFSFVRMLPLLLFLVLFLGSMYALDHWQIMVFGRPWMFLLSIFMVWFWWMSLNGWSGLAPTRRTVSLLVRLTIVGLFIILLAEPRAVRISDVLSVMFVIDMSDSVADSESEKAIAYAADIARDPEKPQEDESGLIVFGGNSAVEMPPNVTFPYEGAINSLVDRGATNIEEALSLAGAMLPEGNQGRVVLISDGIETEGNLNRVVDELISRGIMVDILPIEYTYDSEVWLERLDLPHSVKIGESYEASIVLSSITAGSGKLNLYENGEKIAEQQVEFEAGKNRFVIPIQLRNPGYYEYTAELETEEGIDNLSENNRMVNYLYIQGEGSVLLVTDPNGDAKDWADLQRAISESKRQVKTMSAYEFPRDSLSLMPYDAIFFVNVGANEFDVTQQQAMHDAVKNLGVGFAMLGGENSYGPGGYHRTVIEDALPVTMDVSNKKVLPKGALAIILHTCEFPQGNTWGKRIAKQAIKVLSRQDEAGILVYGPKGEEWLFDLTPTSEYEMMAQKINSAQIGDMPSFATTMELGLKSLSASDASAKHMIVISDGDPQPPTPQLIKKYQDSQISISTIAIFPHGGQEISTMRRISEATGGRYYYPDDPNMLPSIFIKEAQTLQRTMIQNETVVPESGFPSPILKGITSIPPLEGYVLTSIKDDAESALQVINEGEQGVDVDPILATWQYGLGKSAAFTSDLSLQWGVNWVNWEQYQAFVQQFVTHISKVHKETSLSMWTYKEGNTGTIVVEDASPNQDFLTVQAQVNGPQNRSETVDLKQVGPRRYEANLPLWGEGRYSVVSAGVSGNRNEQAVGAIINPYDTEYMEFQSKTTILRRIAERTQGKELSSTPAAKEVFDRRESRESSQPIFDWFLIALACLVPLDVALRRIQIDWYLLSSWFSWGGKKTESTATMGTLLDRKQQLKGSFESQRESQRAQQLANSARKTSTGTMDLKQKAKSAAAETRKTQERQAEAKQAEEKRKTDSNRMTSKLLEIKRRREEDKEKGN